MEAWMADTLVVQPTVKFLGEWLTSTVDLLFSPGGKAVRTVGHAQPAKNLGFAASSLGVAFVLFQADVQDWDITKAGPLALLYLTIWCVYSVGNAVVLRILRGSQSPLANILVGIRLLAIFYVVAMIIGSIVFYASNRNAELFYISFFIVAGLLYLIYFPLVFCKLNDLHKGAVIIFVVLTIPSTIVRAGIADAAAGYPIGRAVVRIWGPPMPMALPPMPLAPGGPPMPPPPMR
jgi:hypothetical protein